MSYCRWSSDNWKCDIYAYEHVGGYIAIHVAARRRKGAIPELPDITTTPSKEWRLAYEQQQIALDEAELVPIGLPFDGQTFEESTIRDAIERMIALKLAGYYVPDWAIEAMQLEAETSS